jgi:hypothetical protein
VDWAGGRLCATARKHVGGREVPCGVVCARPYWPEPQRARWRLGLARARVRVASGNGHAADWSCADQLCRSSGGGRQRESPGDPGRRKGWVGRMGGEGWVGGAKSGDTGGSSRGRQCQRCCGALDGGRGERLPSSLFKEQVRGCAGGRARCRCRVSDSGGLPARVPPDGRRSIAKRWLACRPITILGVLSSQTG